MKIIRLAIVEFCLILATNIFIANSYGAEVLALNTVSYQVIGELKTGDFEKFINLAILKNERPSSILITSPGGSIDEALKFGRFANNMFMSCGI